jgi:hypothetical protein
MIVRCMNAVRNPANPADWVRCGWEGEIADKQEEWACPCPRCCKVGMLAQVIDVPK